MEAIVVGSLPEGSRSAGLGVTSLAATLLAVALVVSGCGDNDANATDRPTKSAPGTTAATATPTSPAPTQSATAEPLSPFEDKAPVKAARAWAAAASRAVNDHDRSLGAVVPLTTHLGFTQTRDYFTKDDLEHGYVLPGPAPFTPVSVRVSGTTATLNVCIQDKGWSRNRRTGKPVRKPSIDPFVFQMRKVGGAWKLDRYYAGSADCGGVRVQGVEW